MIDETKQELLNYYKLLPRELQELVISDKIDAEINRIGIVYHLTSEQLESLSDLVTSTILGIDLVRNFETNIKSDLLVDGFISKKILISIFTTIFNPLLSSLQKTQPDFGSIAKSLNIASVPLPNRIAQSARQATAPDQIPETHPYHLLEKAKVLAEIERPTPNRFIPPNAPIARPPMPVAKPSAPTPTPAPQIRTLQKDLERGKTEGTFANIISQKLAGPTTISQIEKVLPPTTNPRATDPYREAF